MEITSGSWTRSGRFCALAFGSATSTPWWSMGAAIMKMMSSTSITSTSGVTLMSAITGSSSPFSPPRLKAISLPLKWNQMRSGEIPLREVEELEHEVLHPGAQPAQVLGEIVVGDEGRNGGGEAGGGVDQRLGVAGLEDAHQRRGAELARHGVDLAEALAAMESLHELLALPVGAAEMHQLAQDDGPGAEREEDQDAEDQLPHRAALNEKPEDAEPLLGAELEYQGRREHARFLISLLRQGVPPGERTMAPRPSKGRAA